MRAGVKASSDAIRGLDHSMGREGNTHLHASLGGAIQSIQAGSIARIHRDHVAPTLTGVTRAEGDDIAAFDGFPTSRASRQVLSVTSDGTTVTRPLKGC